MSEFVEFRRKAVDYLDTHSFSTGCIKIIRTADAAASEGLQCPITAFDWSCCQTNRINLSFA